MNPLEQSARAWLADWAERRAAVLRVLAAERLLAAERKRKVEPVNPAEWRRVALLQMGSLT